MLNRTCNAWTKPMMVLMMHTWQVNVSMDKNREMLGKYVMKFTELKPSMVFGAWKKWTAKCKRDRADFDLQDLIKKVNDTKKELEETNIRVQRSKVVVSKANAVNAKIQRKLDEAVEPRVELVPHTRKVDGGWGRRGLTGGAALRGD